MTAIVALTAGLVFAVGVVAIVAGVLGVDPDTPTVPPTDWAAVARRWGPQVASGVAALVVAYWTGWPVAGLAVVVATWLLPQTVRAAREQRRQRDTLDATRMWLLQLRTTLQAGVGLETAMRETAAQTRPDSPLYAPLRRAVRQLEWAPPASALERLARDLDNHVADTAVVVLTSALTQGQAGVATALESLGGWATDDLAQRRRVDAEGRGTRLSRWIVLGIWLAIGLYLALSSPDLMDPYSTPFGQVVLLGIGALAAVAIWLITRWSAVAQPERFFRRGDRGAVSR